VEWLIWFVFLTASGYAWAADNNPLLVSTDVSNEGYFVLNWDTGNEESELVLEQADSERFDQVISRDIPGTGAITITGLEDGTYFFRLRQDSGPIGSSVQVTVQHHSLARAGSFFALGAALFGTLVFIILNGNRKANL